MTTSLAEGMLQSFGLPVERSGFVLGLPGGDLGVADACSGIASLTALTAVAAFVAYLRWFGPARGIALLVLTVPLVAGANALRVVSTGLIQEAVGADYIRGGWHEGLGLAAVLTGTAGVLGLARLLQAIGPDPVPPAPQDFLDPTPPTRWVEWSACAILVGGVGVSVAAFGFVGPLTSPLISSTGFERVPLVLGGWQGVDRPVPGGVAEMLVPDAIAYRIYENNLGRQAHGWVMCWQVAWAIKGYHHPDVCWPNRGYRPVDRRRIPVNVPGFGSIDAEGREFARGPERQVVVSWTQEGPRVWTDEDERQAARGGAGSWANSVGWAVQMLVPEGSEGVDPRLTVLVAVPGAGDAVRNDAAAVAGLLAAEVYRLDPRWAPGTGR